MGNGLQQFYYIQHICNDHGRRTKDTAKQHSTVNQEKKNPTEFSLIWGVTSGQ